uniref:Transmembrane protein n=1 Tax=Pithovirus LCPAC001 TaxID=2506585 RepID=A0A481Z1L0_9VIRU|nr:MAG: hypothetical protein LCPAC001_01020 [Pithovirus LCPAC001]
MKLLLFFLLSYLISRSVSLSIPCDDTTKGYCSITTSYKFEGIATIKNVENLSEVRIAIYSDDIDPHITISVRGGIGLCLSSSGENGTIYQYCNTSFSQAPPDTNPDTNIYNTNHDTTPDTNPDTTIYNTNFNTATPLVKLLVLLLFLQLIMLLIVLVALINKIYY